MKKYKIGYTTGVFDLFHVGHLNILEKSKEQCEKLIVAVCTDEYTQETKHITPVIPYENRAKIIAALKCVDEVVPMTFTDKKKAWELYHFDALFSGDDWKGTPRYNETEKQMAEIGVDVVYIPYTQGVSSTQIKQELAARGQEIK